MERPEIMKHDGYKRRPIRRDLEFRRRMGRACLAPPRRSRGLWTLLLHAELTEPRTKAQHEIRVLRPFLSSNNIPHPTLELIVQVTRHCYSASLENSRTLPVEQQGH